MRTLGHIIIGILLIAFVTCCIASGDNKMKSISTATIFSLSDSDLDMLKKKALNGDEKSAFKVYQHYDLGKGDIIYAFPWLQIAANHGNVAAQHNLGYIYIYTELFKNIQLGKFWLKEAAINGSTKAKKLLEEIEEDSHDND